MSEQTLIEAEILRLAEACGADKSISPAEVAHAVTPGAGDAWRQKLSAVRRAAIRLAQEGRIDILRKGKPVEAAGVKGVIRLRLRPRDQAAGRTIS